jgi:YfiH family protein
MDLVWLQVPRWNDCRGLLHGFLGRRGGKSAGRHASLNLSFRVGDDPEVVKDNLCSVKKAVGVHDLRVVTMNQVHGDHIVDVKDRRLKEAGDADGMVTAERGLFLGVLAADCVPILFVAPGREIAAVVHAGWRGTLAGIAVKMVAHLGRQYGIPPGELEAASGPAIGCCCYEVGRDVSDPLTERWGDAARACVESRNGKLFLDLRELNRRQLESVGVPAPGIFSKGPCTSCARDDFFSYRRDRTETGRQLSFVGYL